MFPFMQFRRRVEDRIRDLLKQALATYHPSPSVLSELQAAVREYRALKASGRRLYGQRSDDLAAVRNAFKIGTVGQQPH